MTNYFVNGSTGAYLNFRKLSLIPGYLFHMQKFVKGHQNQCQLQRLTKLISLGFFYLGIFLAAPPEIILLLRP